jgi:hypothetical protein
MERHVDDRQDTGNAETHQGNCQLQGGDFKACFGSHDPKRISPISYTESIALPACTRNGTFKPRSDP